MKEQRVQKFTVPYNSMVGDLFNYEYGRMHNVKTSLPWGVSYPSELYEMWESFERAYTKRFQKFITVTGSNNSGRCPVYHTEYGRSVYIKTNYSMQKWCAPRASREFDPQATHEVFWKGFMKRTEPFNRSGDSLVEIRGYIYDNFAAITMRLIEAYYRRDDFTVHVDLREGKIDIAFVDLLADVELHKTGKLQSATTREEFMSGDALTVTYAITLSSGKVVNEPVAHLQVHEKKAGGKGRDTVTFRLQAQTLTDLVESKLLTGVTSYSTYMDSRAEIRSLCGKTTEHTEKNSSKRKTFDDLDTSSSSKRCKL